MLSLSPFTKEETEAQLVWPKARLLDYKLEFEPRQPGSESRGLGHYSICSIEVLIMTENELCARHCYWQGEDETYASK